MSLRHFVFAATLAVLPCAQAEELTLIGEFTLPTGLKIGGVEFGGVSALDYDRAEDVFLRPFRRSRATWPGPGSIL